MFKDATKEEDKHEKALQEASNAMKGNTMPKGVMSLEKLYDLQNQFRRPTNTETQSSKLSSEQVNLGTQEDLKYVNLVHGILHKNNKNSSTYSNSIVMCLLRHTTT